MITKEQVEEHYLRPVGLRVRSTDDVSQEALDTVFQIEDWNKFVHVESGRTALHSTEPPSWVHLFATLEWWQQLAVSAATVVGSGYLQQAGVSIWKNQKKFSALVSERLWAFADRIITLQQLLPNRTEIVISFPSKDVSCPVYFAVESRDVEAVALQIAMLIYHSRAIEQRIQSLEFQNCCSPYLHVLGSGAISLTCFERIGDGIEQRVFNFD
jgi:hypothetical protein